MGYLTPCIAFRDTGTYRVRISTVANCIGVGVADQFQDTQERVIAVTNGAPMQSDPDTRKRDNSINFHSNIRTRRQVPLSGPPFQPTRNSTYLENLDNWHSLGWEAE